MHCTDRGYQYRLATNLDGVFEQLSFLKKIDGRIESHGVTDQEVLLVLIDRMYYHQKQSLLSSREYEIVKTKLEECVMWLDKKEPSNEVRSKNYNTDFITAYQDLAPTS